jgi:hypothetical protein
MSPNEGAGDNVGFVMAGPGTNAFVQGGVPFGFFCNSLPSCGFAPGGGGTSFYSDNVNGYIGGYGPNAIEWKSVPTLFVGAFTFPTNGRSVFTVTVPASLSDLSLTAFLPSGQTQQIFLNVKPFQLTLSFSYSPQDGVYYPNQASFLTTPEPGSPVLTGTGLCAVLGSVRRRLRL